MVAKTSRDAYAHSAPRRAVNDQWVLDTLKNLPEGQDMSGQDLADLFCMIEGTEGLSTRTIARHHTNIQGRCSDLHKSGQIIRTRTIENPETRAQVYHYAFNRGKIIPQEKISKSYKEKYETLLEILKEKTEQIETLILIGERLREKIKNLEDRANIIH